MSALLDNLLDPVRREQCAVADAASAEQAIAHSISLAVKPALDKSYTVTHYTKLARQAAFLANQPPGEYVDAVRAVLHACALVAELDKSGRWECADDASELLDRAFDVMQDKVMPV